MPGKGEATSKMRPAVRAADAGARGTRRADSAEPTSGITVGDP
ncbi:hypothetical protein SSAG_05954 [Streptomyces sp. Mg1]|nr:hypothetical protein SSAG_05954 [Streptomyces sp. Mg1]